MFLHLEEFQIYLFLYWLYLHATQPTHNYSCILTENAAKNDILYWLAE